MALFGNSLEAQLSRALFQQDIYRRMLDAYEERVSKEKFESKKSEEEFWSNYDKLVESISTTKTEIDNFYQKNDLYLFPKKDQAREALISHFGPSHVAYRVRLRRPVRHGLQPGQAQFARGCAPAAAPLKRC